MKHFLCLFLAFLLFLPLSACCGEETGNACAYVLERTEGPNGSYVAFPRFISGSEAAEKINKSIAETAEIEAYLRLLDGLSENGTGLQMDCSITAGKRYVSILLTAEGKMLSGPPAKAAYPFVFDAEIGESVSFERLFTDADLAKDRISTLIGEEIQPHFSAYLENSDLEPVPFERFCIKDGTLLICYDKGQLSFLSGDPGAVSFRFSELHDLLDWREDAPLRDMIPAENYEASWPENADRQAWQRVWSEKGRLCGLSNISIGDDLQAVLEAYKCTLDDGFYPGGACYEVEAAELRGTLLLTDENAEKVLGILTSRLDSMGIETGKTTLAHAVSLLGEPDARMEMDADTAERYLVCQGTAAQYQESVSIGDETVPAAYTLYADTEGIVRFILLSIL